MNNINTTGYTSGSNTENNNFNIIPSRYITMANVDKQLRLVPIIDGKPQYDKGIIASPGDDDIDFGEGVTGVIEIPYSQMGGYMTGLNYTPQNFNTALNYARGIEGNSYSENANLNMTNPYAGQMPNQRVNQYINDENLTPINTTMNDVMLPNTQTQLDNNLRQQQEALSITNNIQQPNQRTGAPFSGAINPYGDWNASNTASFLGASIQDGNTLGIIGSAGKLALSLGRDAFAGASAMKRYNEAQNEYLERDARQRQTQGQFYAQKGGEVINKRPGLLLTGNFLEGSDDNTMANAEVEKGEIIQTPDGNTMEIVGDKHSTGGELITVPEGTKVVSDYLKIGGKLATYFKKNYDINVSAKSTFATVLDKYKKKIGLTKLLEEEAGIMDKIVDQDEVEMDSTRDINLQVLSKRVNDLQPQKQPLEQDFNSFTNLVFQKQEEQKETEKDYFEKQEGGQVDQNQAMLMQAISQYAEMNGQTPEEVMNQIQAMPAEQQQQAITQIMNSVGGNEQQPQSSNIEELINAYAQLVGQDPNTIIEQMQQMSEEEAMAMIQEMSQAVSGTQEQPQVESEMTPDPNSAPSEDVETMQAGGTTGLRNKILPTTYDTLPFTAVNIDGVVDYDLQHLNSQTGVYDNFDPNARIGRYLRDVPVGAENYFEQKQDGNYGLREGVQYSDFQRGYNDLMGRTNKFFQTQTEGMTEAQKQAYLNNLSKYQNDIIFTTDKESEYAGKTARGIDNKFGQFTSTRSGYQRPVVTPEQKKQLNDLGVYKLSQLLTNPEAKKIVGDELYNQLEKENTDFGGIDYGILDKPTVQPEQTTTVETTPQSDISAYTPRNSASLNLPIQTPDQSNLPPNYLATSMRQVGTNLADRIFLSPEENLKELARQASTASNQIVSNNPYTAGAGLSSLQANQNNAINQAITQTTIANQQDERNVNNINEQRIQQRDQTNLGLADKYEREQIVGLDNYIQSWRNYIDNRNRQNLNSYNLQAQVNAFNALNSNYQIGSMGEIYQTDEPFIVNINGQQVAIDPKTRSVVTEKVTSADGKTTTTTRTKKKTGGFITTDLSKLLK